MALNEKDLKAIQKLLVPLVDRVSKIEVRMENFTDHFLRLEGKIFSLEDRMNERFNAVDERFNVVDQNFDALFKFNETREQEYLVITSQMSGFEKRLSKLEKRSA